ncbi:helix-turn-helix domain-containing protein [Streptomyces sp. HU2014]|uniref:PucR family transcriptional regulator n=1 Tax=Streptomyces sp. HU2014 TaxID=2939414 RepID=UPI0032C48832
MLNRIWSRPRGEWTRVLRKELPAVAASVAEELQRGTPAFSAVSQRIGTEATRAAVEQALLRALGLGQVPGADPERIPPGTGPRPRRKPAQVVTAMPATRARQALFAALTDDRHVPGEVLAELAGQAGWPLPRRVRAVVLGTPNEALTSHPSPHSSPHPSSHSLPHPLSHTAPQPGPQLAPQLAPALAAALGHGLPGTVEADLCLLVPDPGLPGRAALEAALGCRVAAVGHSVPVADAAASLRWARRLLAVAAALGGPAERVVCVDDHLSELLMLQDESLARALSARWLRPLEDLTPRQSERLEVTLLAWLESGGAPEAARTLKVHPQTVRYRLRQIEKLFGPAMREPHTRFELELALRGRRLLARTRQLRSRAPGAARALGAAVHPLGPAGRARVNGL